jgi:hypothetical protein
MDERHTVLELARGELMTDPARHTGEGILGRVHSRLRAHENGTESECNAEETDEEVQKRNDKRTMGGRLGALLGFSRDWAAASRAPVVDVPASCNLSELGIGHVWFSRRLPDGRYAMAGFLVDTFCLGVKNALFKIMGSASTKGPWSASSALRRCGTDGFHFMISETSEGLD